MRKPKVSVNWEEAKLYFLHPTEERNLLPPRQRQFSVAVLQWPQTIWQPSRPVGCEIHACLDSPGKIERYRIFNVFIIKIILFECVSVLFCIFHISFGARSYGKIARLFNLPFRADSRCSCHASNVNVVFSLFNEWECMEKGSIKSSPNTNYLTCLLGLLCRSKWPIWSIWKVLHAIGDLLPGLSSFVVNHFCYQKSKSLPYLCLAGYYNILIGKRVNATIWQRKGMQTCCSA